MSKAWDALQARFEQVAETVTRNARVDIVSGGVDEVDPPEALDEYAEQARTTGPVRKNLRQYVNDVWEPGYSVEADSEATEDFFTGGENAPGEIDAEGGFLKNSAIFAGERHSDFYEFGKETTWQRWVRGTILVEKLKADPSDSDSKLTGFYHVRPETVYPQVLNNTNILLPPDKDDLPDDIDRDGVTTTRRDEVAAYIQFDDESIVGIRRGEFDRTEIPLSQNDVMKQTLEPDIGSDFVSNAPLADTGNDTAYGVFGTSIIAGIADDISEYKQIKRDRAEAISRKAYGVWTAQFKDEVLDLGNSKEIVRWNDAEIENTEKELMNMGPDDVLTSDANIDLERHDGDVPDLNGVLNQYISIILAPLPAPKYMIGFAEGINRDVTEEQKEAYQDLVSEERRYQEKKWTPVLKDVAESYGLDPSGLKLKIEPETEENPVKSLSSDEIDRMNTYVNTLATAAGPQAGPTALVDREELLDVLDFPTGEMDDIDADDIDDIADTEAAKEAWDDILGVESLATQYAEGDVVQSPQGIGVISGVFTEGFDEVEASEDSPTYAVALQDARVGSEFYKASQLEEAEFPDTGVDDPLDDVEAMMEIFSATDSEYEALDWTMPDSWRESDKPARLILLDAWASMGGQFDCGGACCKGELKSDRLCASMKDEVLGTDEWRGWGNEALAGQSGTGPFADIPVVPTGLKELNPAWLIRWAEWVAAGRPEIPNEEALDWNPALHPRNPETGKFVERSFDVPDDMPDFESRGVKGTLEFLQENGADVGAILDPESGVTIDGVPNDATSVDDVPDGVGNSFEDIDSPSKARDVAVNRIEAAVDGTTASLENMDEQQAQTLTESVEKLAEANAEFFSGVDEIRDHDLNATASAAYDPGQSALVFGPSSMTGNEAYDGYLARNSGFGTVAHEVGHAAHYGDSGENIFDYYFWPEGTTQDDINQIESEVSEYAAESPEEFVAEAFSVLADGGQLPERTREIYNELNGPAYNT